MGGKGLLPISGPIAFNEPELARDAGAAELAPFLVVTISADLANEPLDARSIRPAEFPAEFMDGRDAGGAGAVRMFAMLFRKLQPREPTEAASLASSRLSAELPRRAVKFTLLLESNIHPRVPIAATMSIVSLLKRLPEYF